jgi:UDP-N-acetylmuramoylalanine--D-glutamate ligase
MVRRSRSWVLAFLVGEWAIFNFWPMSMLILLLPILKRRKNLRESLEKLKGFENITYVLGEHRMQDFRDRDLIIKAAGVPMDSPYILEARKNGIPVEMTAALFAALSEIMIVGVTGTRGKSTVTHLVHEILAKAFEGQKNVFLGGNVRGVSTLKFLRNAEKGDIAVLELDSWQLQGFAEQKMSPHIAVFTTFLPDHLNYYQNDLGAYLDDKANIFKFQKSDDFLVLGSQAAGIVLEKYGSRIQSEIIEIGTDFLPEEWKVTIPGLHNRYNAALAYRVARLFNLNQEHIRDVIEHFSGVPGRLELIRNYNGINIYNDTNATTPDATLAGLRAFGTMKNVVLIMGGADKNLDMGHLFLDIPVYAKAVVTLPGTGTDKIKKDIENLTKDNIKVAFTASLKEAVSQAVAFARKGDNIVFSPGFASFGLFKNEYDRGEQFNEIIKSLT